MRLLTWDGTNAANLPRLRSKKVQQFVHTEGELFLDVVDQNTSKEG